jgi:hypothetical protein
MIDQNLAGLDATLNGLYPRHIKAVSTLDFGNDFHDYTEDEDLVRLGSEERYILLTSDTNSINTRKFPPCSHGGIIKMAGMPSKDEVLTRIKKLIRSGPHYLKQIRAHFTHLNSDGAIIYKEHDEVVEVRF